MHVAVRVLHSSAFIIESSYRYVYIISSLYTFDTTIIVAWISQYMQSKSKKHYTSRCMIIKSTYWCQLYISLLKVTKFSHLSLEQQHRIFAWSKIYLY